MVERHAELPYAKFGNTVALSLSPLRSPLRSPLIKILCRT